VSISLGETQMVIKCILSVDVESIKYYAQHFSQIPALPEHINKKGPYVNNEEGASHQLVILYEFERSKLKEAWKYILRQIDSLRRVPGFTLSAHILPVGDKVKGSS